MSGKYFVRLRKEDGSLAEVTRQPDNYGFDTFDAAITACKHLCYVYAYSDYVVADESDSVRWEPTTAFRGSAGGIAVRIVE